MAYFSDQHVLQASESVKAATEQFDNLFNLLAKEIYHEARTLASSPEVMTTVYEHIQQAEDAFKSHFNEHQNVACGKGCSHCCHFPIQLMPQDLESFVTALKEKQSTEQLNDTLDALRHQQSLRQPPFFRAPCAFLDENNSCTVYENRPLACRMFSSENANACKQSLQDGSAISQSTIRYRIFQAATCSLQVLNQQQNRPDTQIDFTLGLISVLEELLNADTEGVKT